MRIFDIKRGSSSDGQGIRTVVFFKGCPLRCVWCHNPESYLAGAQIAFYSEKCVGCGKCADICPKGCHNMKAEKHNFDPHPCTLCRKCINACPANAMTSFGYDISVEDVLKEILKDREYYKFSGGGVTLSGGEPMAQAEAAISLAKAAKEEGISVLLETSGFGKREDFIKISEYIDSFLFDIKLLPHLYEKYTGQKSDIIFENLAELDRLGASFILRCPVIPHINLNTEHFSFIADLAKRLKNVQEINLEAYHPIGLSKYNSLGMRAEYANKDFLEKDELKEYKEFIEGRCGIRVTVQ